MKINHILTSVNNDKYYYDFIPIFIKSWKHFFPNINITIIIVYFILVNIIYIFEINYYIYLK